MNKLVLYTLLFLCPFIISIVGIEILLRKIPNNYMVKGDFLENGSHDVKIIILGSSHGIIGVDPDIFSKKAFNLANYSQTLNIDYTILNRFNHKLDSLEYVVLPISYHLLWINLEGERCKYYNIYYDINLEKNPLKLFLFQDHPMKVNFEKIKDHYLSNPKPTYTEISKGFNRTDATESLDKIEKYAKAAIPLHRAKDLTHRYEENIEYLKKIIDITKSRNAKVLLVTTPTHASYAEHVDKKQLEMMYAVAYELADNKDVFYYDGFNDFNKTEEDRNNFRLYSDADHLSYLGSDRLTLTLDSIITNIDQKKIKTQ